MTGKIRFTSLMLLMVCSFLFAACGKAQPGVDPPLDQIQLPPGFHKRCGTAGRNPRAAQRKNFCSMLRLGRDVVQFEKLVVEHQGKVNDISTYGQESNQRSFFLSNATVSF